MAVGLGFGWLFQRVARVGGRLLGPRPLAPRLGLGGVQGVRALDAL